MRTTRRQVYAALLVSCIAQSGCSRYIDPNVPEPIRPFVEPEYGGEYLLYRPSAYNRDRAWPLIIACHSSFPDSPNKQIRDWTELAESYGFLVAAPTLQGNKRRWPPKPDRQIALQRSDEKHILAVVRHIRAAHNISEDRIFIHGASGGAYAALHMGLRHPELFRAVSLLRPRFDERYITDEGDVIDPYQPVFVDYELRDAVTGKEARRCVEWLKSRLTDLVATPHGVSGALEAEPCVQFFEEVVRARPLIRIRAFPASSGGPLEIQFKLHCSYEPTSYRWEFGDGEESGVPEPVHTFAAPGTYVVNVTVDGPDGTQHHRSARLKVPEAVVGVAASPSANRD